MDGFNAMTNYVLNEHERTKSRRDEMREEKPTKAAFFILLLQPHTNGAL